LRIGSPSTIRHDRLRKLNLYARSGVAEHWLVTPRPFLLEILSLKDGAYFIAGVYTESDRFRSPRFPGLEIDLEKDEPAFPG